jgi:hypothetical protein
MARVLTRKSVMVTVTVVVEASKGAVGLLSGAIRTAVERWKVSATAVGAPAWRWRGGGAEGKEEGRSGSVQGTGRSAVVVLSMHKQGILRIK